MYLCDMKYPIGIQNFEKIRKDGYVYVDKTDFVWKLVNEGSYCFLSRPRRFGKSLLLSTLEAYFQGKRELFEDLAIAGKEKEWKQYPILHLDLNSRDYKDESSLEAELNRHLDKWEKQYGDEYRDRAAEERFIHVIENAFEQTGERVVILVDEYDKPLLQTINQTELQNAYRNKLKAFYSVLKTKDAMIRFAFLTGVTKFGKVSVFSDLNNLIDISMLPQFTTICGITEEELHRNFDESVALLAHANGMSVSDCYERLKEDFDGYHFDVGAPGMYNPFSLLNTLCFSVFRDYWFETGTPSFLVEQLQKTDYPLDMMTEEQLSADSLNSIDTIDENPLPLLYQSGYLTIQGYDKEFKAYQLGFPNGDYQVMGDRELYFQNVMYVVFMMLGFYVEVERHTTDGRMDVLMQTKDFIYIFELKIDQSADVALRQIKERGYALPFANDPRRLFKIGVNFSTDTKRIDDWKIED